MLDCHTPHRARNTAVGLAAALAVLLATTASLAQVATCDALTLYSNAVNTGLCRQLSTGNLWVCELTGANPDVHTTFNAGNNLHITVRTPGPPPCQGNAQLTGNFPGALALQAGAPAAICNVQLQNWVNRLNAVAQGNVPAGQTNCTAGFIAAQAAGRINGATRGFYVNLCAAPAPGAGACP
jgi:hypothetical protein